MYSWSWIQKHVDETAAEWNSSASRAAAGGRCYSPQEQSRREAAYDEALDAVEEEVKRRVHGRRPEPAGVKPRLVSLFAEFSAKALGLEDEMTELLTEEFLPAGQTLAQRARRFDPALGMAEIVQACRNAWTACGLQPLLGAPIGMTPAILGYSLLYPYSDNYLDGEDVTTAAKLRFSERFRRLLQGEELRSANSREVALRQLIELIEEQYPRTRYPQVFDSLLAIHRAQEQSVEQVARRDRPEPMDLMRLTFAKGGSSVLADACLVRGHLTDQEIRFAFKWGVLLQLGDDLQDLQDDMRRGSETIFSAAAKQGEALDSLAVQLLSFSETVGARMDSLPCGSKQLKELLKISWRSLIVRAVADSHGFFSAEFLTEAERYSPFRFQFLRARQQRLTSVEGLYARLFDAFLADGEGETDEMYEEATAVVPV